jgi:hypothetical protein
LRLSIVFYSNARIKKWLTKIKQRLRWLITLRKVKKGLTKHITNMAIARYRERMWP